MKRKHESDELEPVKVHSVPGPTHGLDLAQFAISGVELKETGLAFTRDLSNDEWKSIGRTLAKIGKATPWWLGDWMIYGPNAIDVTAEKREKDRKNKRRLQYGLCDKVAAATGLSPGFLSNVASACRRVLPKDRDGLTIQHALEILGQVPETKFSHWRQLVIRHCWTVRELRGNLRESLRTEKRSPRTKRPPQFFPEILDFVRKFQNDCKDWTPDEWKMYELNFKPILEAFEARRNRPKAAH